LGSGPETPRLRAVEPDSGGVGRAGGSLVDANLYLNQRAQAQAIWCAPV